MNEHEKLLHLKAMFYELTYTKDLDKINRYIRDNVTIAQNQFYKVY
ncbi:hypothetical protein Q428_09425 [Fervidicella metallireducens AeB]|uniref:Uncharacterized protein n=1 Tax=Fervidicella metallireducens AeB TaxID=1403537 RepID=A0A017RUS8_9CLOT|nr:hypothetical protein Q428_09425 [Fervidicella metallireducens AeB]